MRKAIPRNSKRAKKRARALAMKRSLSQLSEISCEEGEGPSPHWLKDSKRLLGSAGSFSLLFEEAIFYI